MKLISFQDLQLKLGGRSRSSVYRDVELGRLPKPIKLGLRVYWKEADVEAALEKALAA